MTTTNRPITELVTLAVAGGIAEIVLDSPANRNALSRNLLAQLTAHLAEALSRDDVAIIVLTHTGSVFCAGADLKEARSGGVSDSVFPDLMAALASSPKPTVARVNGAVRAGGIGLVASCDIVIASERSSFAFPEVRLGVVAAVISTVVLPLMTPRGARELFLTGEKFDVHRAQREGLVTVVVGELSLDDEVNRYTSALMKGGPKALSITKALLLEHAWNVDVHERVAQMHLLSGEIFVSEEGREGLAAIKEKRPAAWVTAIGRGI